MTHQRFTRRLPRLPPAKPGRGRGGQRTRIVLGMAGICLCLVAACTSASGNPAPAGTAALQTGTAAPQTGTAAPRTAAPQTAAAGTATAPAASVGRAYQFLTQMLNLHDPAGATGLADLPTLPQSYLGGVLGIEHYTVSTIYDDALVLDAYLAMHTGWGAVRAERIGAALVNAWTQSRRLFDDYAPGGLSRPGDARIADHSSTTGAVAWAGLALAQLYDATGETRYLDAAVAIGRWIQANCASDRGPGGYTGGYDSSGDRITWKSTENNIDVFAFFRMLARLTGQPVWLNRAQHARRFIVAMWDWPPGSFDVGTIANGVTTNDSARAEDVNSWSYLALRDASYAASVGWDVRNLGSNAGRFRGVSVSTCDLGGVWIEGTAHLADALETLGTPDDIRRAAGYLSDIRYAQAHGPNADGRGIIASSEDGLTDCQGDFLYASLHTGTTAWYILAAKAVDPLSAVPIVDQPVG